MADVRCPSDCNASCNSRPLSPGICTSVNKHVVFAAIVDLRKSSADSKVAVLTKDSTSSRMPSRASASSSTIEINGTSDIPLSEGTSHNQGYQRNHSSYLRNLT